MSGPGGTWPHAAGFVDGNRPRIVTSRFGLGDAHLLERSLATGGYAGLRAALSRPAPEVHDEVRSATVLGRGGAGFPAGTKWGLMPADSWPRYLVVNGDESEPGTYKDRLLMELDPHQLIEGCLIACYAATHPEKLDPKKAAQWAQLAGLAWPADLAPALNLAFLGVPVMKPDSVAMGGGGAGGRGGGGYGAAAPSAASNSALSALAYAL